MAELNALDLNLLTALDALLQEGSVTRAARRVGLSTPAMSHALARIRALVGNPLLVRAGHAMVLTPRAEELKPLAQAVLAQARAVLSPESQLAPADLQRSLLIRASDHSLGVLAVHIDRLVAAEAPGLILRFLPNLDDDGAALRAGEAELAIGIYPRLPPEMRRQRLLQDRFVCVVREGHPLVGEVLTLETFVALSHVQLAPRQGIGNHIDRELQARGLARRVVRAVPYTLAALWLVAQTDYVATVSARLCAVLAPRLGVRVLTPPLPLPAYTLSQIWHPRQDADPAHRFVRDLLLRAARAAETEVPLAGLA